MMQKNWLRWLETFERLITSITGWILAFLSIIVCYQVLARYVLKMSPFWIEEVSTISMMWIGLLGAAGCVWTESHMSLQLVVSKLPESIRVWQRFIVDLIVGVFAVFLFQHGISLVSNTMGGTMATLPVPLGVTYLVLPISAATIILFSFVKAVNRILRYHVVKGDGISA
jgi:TRAP-type C4-dicarboxylate transport system permease small subunit